jgi:hypothetical protein
MAAAGRRQTFFEADGVDQLVSMVLELSAELWTLRQRLYIAERAIEGQSRPLPELIEAYRPSPAEQAELESMRGAMVRELFRTINQPPAASSGSAPLEMEGQSSEGAAA